MMLGVLMAIFENVTGQNAERDLRKKSDFSRFFEDNSQRDLRLGRGSPFLEKCQIGRESGLKNTKKVETRDFASFSPRSI